MLVNDKGAKLRYIRKTMSARKEARLEVPADTEAMTRIREFVEEFGKECRIDRGDIIRALIAIEELVTNIIKYGYGPSGEQGRAALTLGFEGERLTVELVDDSHEFDPFAGPAPDLSAPIEQRRIGGLGLHLVKTLMDRTSYRREGGHNVVAISRRVALET
jgi:anti-sigma regulatory factor (Ser/Thr protein kinase)